MISFKVSLSSVQLLRTSAVISIYLSAEYFPRMIFFLVIRMIINEVNDLLKSKCSVKYFYFINQSNG